MGSSREFSIQSFQVEGKQPHNLFIERGLYGKDLFGVRVRDLPTYYWKIG